MLLAHSWGGVRKNWFTLCFPWHWLQPALPSRCLCLTSACTPIISESVQPGRNGQVLLLLSSRGDGWRVLRGFTVKQHIWSLNSSCFAWLDCSARGYVQSIGEKCQKHKELFSLLFQFEEIFLQTREQLLKLGQGKTVMLEALAIRKLLVFSYIKIYLNQSKILGIHLECWNASFV